MENANENKKVLEGFRKFIRNERILIADANATTRTNVARCLIELGAMQTNLDLLTNYEMASDELKKRKHRVIFCEYNLGTHSGLELLETQKELLGERREAMFVLVTANTSQSAVAQAAEEDVDTYIIKPFSSFSLRQRLLLVAEEKLFPNNYRKKIREGKEFLFAANFAAAEGAFQEARKLDPSPTLACFYLGQTNTLMAQMKIAETEYKSGRALNRIHYKCLVGLFELLMQQEMFTEAYDVVRKIANYFPANPKRLGTVLRLAIMTKNYTDIEKYYQTFVNLDQRNEEIIRYVCAGLIICGKYYLQQKNVARAVELFRKASVSAQREPKLLREIISSLTEYNLFNQAQAFMKEFPPETMNKIEFRISQFLVSSKFLSPVQMIDQGKELIKEMEKKEAIVYKVVMLKMVEAGLSAAAQEFYERALKECPHAQAEIELCWKTRRMDNWRPSTSG